MKRQPRKPEGFRGQRIVVLPRKVVAGAGQHPLLRGLLPTDVGMFPKAAYHFVRRPFGVEQAIFIYCVKGRGWCELQGRRHQVEPGELLVIPPEMPHAYGAAETPPWTIHWFHCQGALVPEYLAALEVSAQQPLVYLGDDAKLLVLFEDVLSILEHGYMTSHLVYAAMALGHVLGAMVLRRREARQTGLSVEQKLAQTLEFMKQHLEQPLRVATLASLANLSPSHFAALFKKQTGYSAIDYFIRLRMQRACQLLDTTTLSVKEVSGLVGFQDPLYFSRVFKAVNDVSPQHYRMTRKG